MRPYERWNDLWQFFMALDMDFDLDHGSEEAAIANLLSGAPDGQLHAALREWHEAFDGASDEQVSEIVGDFNPSYDPKERFGGDRGWAEWVRRHLEAELASRST